MNKMNLKTLMLSGALALGAQNVLASSPLPCPKGAPINDTIGVLQSDIKSNVHNRLMQIDREKFHQIVIITVNSPDEYGYDTLAHMGADTINKCGIGYRGENTGTIVWYSNNFDADKNKYFISTASGVSGYITDNLARRLVASSKETCDKANVSCRMDDITKGLDAIITKHLASKEQVQVIQDGIKTHDQKEASAGMEHILQMLGLGGLVILVVGGGIKLQNNLTASKKRKELKKKILEVAVKFEQEKAKYPEWFVSAHMLRDEKTLKDIQNKSDIELEGICRSLSKLNQLKNITLGTIENNLASFAGLYQDIVEGVDSGKKKLETKIAEIKKMYGELDSTGYIYTKVSLESPKEKSNPEATLNSYNEMISSLISYIGEISQIPQFYKSTQGFDTKLTSDFTKFKGEFEQSQRKYESIFGKYNSRFSLSALEGDINSIITGFKNVYQKKDVSGLKQIMSQSEGIFSSMKSTISAMNSQVSWYEGLPREISALESRLKEYTPSAEYVKNEKTYTRESGKRKFAGYDMGTKLSTLTSILATLKSNYANKTGFADMKGNIATIGSELDMMEEYIGLGAVAAAIIAQRVAEAEAARQRQIEAERREAERRRREAEEEAERERRRSESSSSTWTTSSRNDDSGGWSSGGGGGGDGGGGGGD